MHEKGEGVHLTRPRLCYIGTSLSRIKDHNYVRDLLAASEIGLSYDWTTHGSVRERGPEAMAAVCAAEIEGIRAADLVIILLPAGRGTHAELGAAHALGKRIVIHSDDEEKFGFFGSDTRTSTFYHAPDQILHHTGSFEDLAAASIFWMCQSTPVRVG